MPSYDARNSALRDVSREQFYRNIFINNALRQLIQFLAVPGTAVAIQLHVSQATVQTAARLKQE